MNKPKRKDPVSELVETLLNPDHEQAEMGDRMIVVEAANLLQVGEFQLLQLAYRDWFDKDLPEALVARLFASYMLHNDVPHWARHYARAILDASAEGTLDDNAPKYHRYDHDYHTTVPQGVRKFCIAVACIALFLGGGIVMAHIAVQKSGSMFPPYLDREDLPPKRSLQPGAQQSPDETGAPRVVIRMDRLTTL